MATAASSLASALFGLEEESTRLPTLRQAASPIIEPQVTISAGNGGTNSWQVAYPNAMPTWSPLTIGMNPAPPNIGEEGGALREGYGLDQLSAEHQAEVVAEVRAEGLEVIYAADSQLLLDIDTLRDEKQYQRAKAILQEVFPNIPIIFEEWESRSHNKHVRVSTPWEMNAGYRLAWEMALGGDQMRGLYNLIKLRNRVAKPAEVSCLFKPPEREE